jgi:hypothetical protein
VGIERHLRFRLESSIDAWLSSLFAKLWLEFRLHRGIYESDPRVTGLESGVL